MNLKRFVLILLSALILVGSVPVTVAAAPYENISYSAFSARSLVLGDINGSGSLELGDAIGILRYLSHLENDVFIESAADYDQDGKIALSDAIAILRVLANIDKPKGDLMDNVDISEFCPDSASQYRYGTTYPNAEHKTYYSTTTGLYRGVNIVLPENYDSSKKYPVIYMLHGIFCNENTFLDDHNYRLVEICTNLARDGLAKEMIIVFPNMYASSNPNQQPSFEDAASILPYDNFINDLVTDLMPFIESNYSVLTERDNTAIAGFSMGGRESLFIGFQRPDLFGYVGAFAPAPGLTPMQDWAFNHPGQLQENQLTFNGKDYSPSLLMICGGTNDTVVGSTYRHYDDIMNRNGVKHICYDITGAGHDHVAVNSGFYNFIRYIF